MLKLTIEMGNAAFADDPNAELARILRGLIFKAESETLARPGARMSGAIRDVNGNHAGEWSCDLEGDE